MYNTVHTNGTSYAGVRLGILMLQSTYPRIYGELGNAHNWDFPVSYAIVKGADVNSIVEDDARHLYDLFLWHGNRLVQEGCTAITTSCGYLSLLQDQLSGDLGVPVATSSLMQYPMIKQFLPADKQVGIITINKASLTDDHLTCAGVALDAPLVGLEGRREINRVILTPEPTLDVYKSQQDVLDAAFELQKSVPNLGAILLECTNLSPYACAVSQAIKVPVFDINTMVNWFVNGVQPRYYNTPISYAVRP